MTATAVAGPRYRWAILGVGVGATTAYSAVRTGLPALAPHLSDRFGLNLAGVGLLFGSMAFGQVLTTYGWGRLADRRGERLVLATGLSGGAVVLSACAFASTVPVLLVLLTLTGMLGASAVTGSGRAVMGWFPRRQRGTALGIRQMAIPLGGALGALTLPWLTDTASLRAAFLALGALMLSAGVTALLWMRDPPEAQAAASNENAPAPIRDARIWRLAGAGACLLAAQTSIVSFLVIFLHDERGLAVATAALFLALLQVGGAVMRLVTGWWSDRRGRRLPLIRLIGAASAAFLGLSALLGADVPVALTLAVLLPAGVLSMSWNGLSLTATMEMAGGAQAGAALGILTTVIAISNAVMPPLFGLLVEAVGWRPAFAVLGVLQVGAVLSLRPLILEEEARVHATER